MEGTSMKDLIGKDNKDLEEMLANKKIIPAGNLESIVLSGGLGTRLDSGRKRISPENSPEMDKEFFGQNGPKGMTMMSCKVNDSTVKKPMTDWHLDIHASCKEVRKITIALAHKSEMIINYYKKKHGLKYRGVLLDFIIEKRPSGTIAPLVKLHQSGKLPSVPIVYANGDDLIDIDFYKAYLIGIIKAAELGLDINELVIDIVSMIPWEQSGEYGNVDMDFDSGLIRSFREKSKPEHNKHIEIDGQKMSPINSGISIIVNPKHLLDKHLTRDIIETCSRLEDGSLDYNGSEDKVKYENFYGTLASKGKMIGVYSNTYWIDLGTEDKIKSAEENFTKYSKSISF